MPPRRYATGAEASRFRRADGPRRGRTRILVVVAKVARMLAIERASPSKIPSRRLCIAHARIQIETAAELSP